MTINPKLVFSLASIAFAITGISYILAPTWNAQLVFGHRLLRSSEPYCHVLMQCLGGAAIFIASILCTASKCVTETLCKGVAFGHFINASLKMFSLITGWSGDTSKGAYEKSLPAWSSMLFHLIMGVLFWLASSHSSIRQTGGLTSGLTFKTMGFGGSGLSGGTTQQHQHHEGHLEVLPHAGGGQQGGNVSVAHGVTH